MTITVTFADGRYAAEVVPDGDAGASWATESGLSAKELVDALAGHGCRHTEIGEAMFAVNPDWLSELGDGQ